MTLWIWNRACSLKAGRFLVTEAKGSEQAQRCQLMDFTLPAAWIALDPARFGPTHLINSLPPKMTTRYVMMPTTTSCVVLIGVLPGTQCVSS
jgi:hypothetical protein